MTARPDRLADVLPAEAARRAQRARERWAGWAALALIVVWGANFSVQKAVFAVLSPGGFLFVRYLVMPAAAALLLCWLHGTRWPRVGRADRIALLKLGLAGHLLHVTTVSWGIHWSTAFSSSLILALGPVFTLLILRWYGIERLTRGQVLGVALACVGVLVFLSDKLFGGHWRASGGDLVLLVSLPAGLRVEWSALPATVWVGVLWAVLVAAFLGWLAWGWINAVRGVARTAPLLYLMPPVAGLVAWAVTGESYTWAKLAGAGLALGGVALAQFTGRRARDEVLESVAPVVD